MIGDREQKERPPIAVDIYGIKTTTTPSDLGEARPTSWSDVSDQLKGHLFRLATAPTRLVVEVLEGATRVVRGISSLPAAVAARLERSHREADHREASRQQQPAGALDARGATPLSLAPALAPSVTPAMSEPRGAIATVDVQMALSQIAEILERYRALGTDAYITFDADGRVIVVVGVPKGTETHVADVVSKLSLPSAEDQSSS